LTTSITSTHLLSLKINDMSSLFPSYSEIDLMIGCMLLIHACLYPFVNCQYLVLALIWLYAYLSYVPRFGLVKLIVYHVNFVTIRDIQSWKLFLVHSF
jgi:hypothetical protein